MKLHIQATPWDLYICIGYLLGIAGILVALGSGFVFAILLVLFAPGYLFVAALFPRTSEISVAERVILSIGASLAITPLVSLLLNFTPWGIHLESTVGLIVALSMTFGLFAYLRRMELPVGQRLLLKVEISAPDLRGYSTLERALAFLIVLAAVASTLTAASVLLAPREGGGFTEFYLLSTTGSLTGLDPCLNATQIAAVTLGIVNHEMTSVEYSVRVDLVGVRLKYNATSGLNETVEVNRTTWSRIEVPLGEGKNWVQPYTFSINATSLWKVQFLLFKNRDFSLLYRHLQLLVRVPCP